jgi:protein-L-isoaspartate(D-aspartate) O-methyltransferase
MPAPDTVEARELAGVARDCRVELARRIDEELGPFDPRLLDALVEVPRERFVRWEDIASSAADIPLPLDDLGFATISAPHAYLLSFRLVELSPGDRLVELGSGSGYGAALAARAVGPSGHVQTLEIDGDLASRARGLLSDASNVTPIHADALQVDLWGEANKFVCTFAVETLPAPWTAKLPDGGILVAPVGPNSRDQRLVRVSCRGELVRASEHGAVRYVTNRSGQV